MSISLYFYIPEPNFIRNAPAPEKARNTRDIKNGGERFECVNYCLLNKSNTPSENNMEISET